jgi:hypothetical protein
MWIGEAIFKCGSSFTPFDKLQIFEPLFILLLTQLGFVSLI